MGLELVSSKKKEGFEEERHQEKRNEKRKEKTKDCPFTNLSIPGLEVSVQKFLS